MLVLVTLLVQVKSLSELYHCSNMILSNISKNDDTVILGATVADTIRSF